MNRRIKIDPVTRIEGHAKITIDVDDAGKILDANFHVVEFRGFEKIAEGRGLAEMPGLMARVCGICPVSHVVSSSKAGDEILGVEIPIAAEKQRRLATYAQVLQSHALSFFHLSSPDLLLGMDSDPANRHIFGVAAVDPDLARRGIRLRQFGQRVVELLGGKRVHPAWSIPGGVTDPFTVEKRDEALGWLPEAYASMELALGRLKGVLDRHRDEIAHLGAFPTLFLGLVNEDGDLEYYDGKIRIIDGGGNVVAEALDPKRFNTYIGEATVPTTFLKPAFYKPLGYPGGVYRVGPLARLNIVKSTGTPRSDRELKEFRQHGKDGVVLESFHYHFARLIEMLHSIERMEQLLEDPDLLGEHVQARAVPNRREGVGCAEAPRGILFHNYRVDEDGLVKSANLLIATAQNHGAMNLAVKQAAQRYVRADKLEEGMLNRVEAAIRAFDPCLSCSTHALGQMPLVVELRDSKGEIVDRVARG